MTLGLSFFSGDPAPDLTSVGFYSSIFLGESSVVRTSVGFLSKFSEDFSLSFSLGFLISILPGDISVPPATLVGFYSPFFGVTSVVSSFLGEAAGESLPTTEGLFNSFLGEISAGLLSGFSGEATGAY
jgi:hypothetical protein